MNLSKKVLAIVLFVLPSFVLGHEGKSHPEQDETTLLAELDTEIATKINKEYLLKIKPSFKAKCFDCHSNNTEYPWYSSLPIVSNLIKDDIKEGLTHLDLSNDFPFGGHGNAEEDLNALNEVLENNSMPPFRYWILHWNSDLSDKEKTLVKDWISKSLKLIQQSKPKKEKNHE